MVITTLKLVSLQEVVRGEVTRQARVIAAFDTCCGAKPWKVVLGMLLERNWRGTGRESRALYTLGDQGHAGARCNIGVFFFAQDMNETVQILMFAVAQGLFGLVPDWAGAISEVTVHVRAAQDNAQAQLTLPSSICEAIASPNRWRLCAFHSRLCSFHSRLCSRLCSSSVHSGRVYFPRLWHAGQEILRLIMLNSSLLGLSAMLTVELAPICGPG